MKTLQLFTRKNAEDFSFQVLNTSRMLEMRDGVNPPPNYDPPPDGSGDDIIFPPDWVEFF